MTLSPALLLVILAGSAAGAGVVLLLRALRPEPEENFVRASSGAGVLDLLKGLGRRLPLAVLAGLGTLLLTRWVVVAVACAAFILLWDKLFGSTRQQKHELARIEGLAAWTESLRDTVAGAVGLEQAIPATAHAASPAIADDLQALADRLRVRVPLPEALQRFADDMDDSGADLIIAALILNARLRGPGLRGVLTSLATSAREELEMRQRVNAGRRSTQRSVQIVVGVTVFFVVGLRLFNPGYVEPYGTPVGQLVLLVILGCFAAGILWLRRLAHFETPERFLRTVPAKGRA